VSPIPHEHSLEVWTGKETVKFLQGRDRRRPFFVQMSFERPHAPLSPSPERAHMYRPEDIDIPSSARDLFERRFATKPAFQRAHIERKGTYPYVPADKHELQVQLTHYYALVTICDEEIGSVIEHLRKEGDLENTIIVYVADHGDFAGDHGLVQKNFGIYESIHRIPFLLTYPGCPQGRKVDELVESVDLYPTLCRLMDVPAPASVEGKDLLPVIQGSAPGKDAVICEWSWAWPTAMIHAIRTKDFRLVYYGSKVEGELYDRRADPDELVNLYSELVHRATRLSLLERLLDSVANYAKKSDFPADRRLESRTRNCLTHLIHKGMKRWSDVAPLYKPLPPRK
jgi:choline-sulfatase/uncharacterized sulfatase